MAHPAKTKHFEVLDGLRGTAALAVVVFHQFEYIFPSVEANPLRHTYLAVDFFFLLSGFVIAHAYDHRWPAMSMGEFFRIRLTRLHPLVLLGASLGLVDYIFDPFAGDSQRVSSGLLLANFALGALLLPAPALPNRFNGTHSLNGPSWSLMQEYAVNIVYAFIGPRIGQRTLLGLVVMAGVVLSGTAISQGQLGQGWSWDTFWVAPVRVAYPFFAGVLLYRWGGTIPVKWGYPILSIVLLGVFMTPNLGSKVYNGLADAVWIIVIFPAVVAAGAGSEVEGVAGTVCRFVGRISYPIYILHYPFIDIFAHWFWSGTHSNAMVALVSVSLLVFLVAFAWAADRFYDGPVRRGLAGLTRQKKRWSCQSNLDGAARAG